MEAGLAIHADGRRVAFLSYDQCSPERAEEVADLLCHGLPDSDLEWRLYHASVARETARMRGEVEPEPEPMVVEEAEEDEVSVIAAEYDDVPDEEAAEFVVLSRAQRLARMNPMERGERNV